MNFSDSELKAMALMQHLGSPFFTLDGFIFVGDRAEVEKHYKAYLAEHSLTVELSPLIEFCHESVDTVDASYDCILAVGYQALGSKELTIQDEIDVIAGSVFAGVETVMGQTFFLFQTPENTVLPKSRRVKYSPGPWTHSPMKGKVNHCFRAQVWDATGHNLAALESKLGEEVASGTAQVMAGAPDMIEALQNIEAELYASRPDLKKMLRIVSATLGKVLYKSKKPLS